MANNGRTFEFTAAVRGFHVFRKTWKPLLNKLLNWFNEQGNDFDYFSIKTCKKDDNEIVGHLPREISRPRKFLIDRGARVTAQITNPHYRKSPLLQGGMEVRCKVSATMPGTIKNHLLLDRYKELVEKLYCEPKNEFIIANFLTPGVEPNLNHNRKAQGRKTKEQRKRKNEKEQTSAKNDIRNFFSKQPKSNKEQNNKTKNTESKKKSDYISVLLDSEKNICFQNVLFFCFVSYNCQ